MPNVALDIDELANGALLSATAILRAVVSDTEIHAVSGDPERAWKAAGRIPLGRPGDPAEIANAIAWLLSDQAAYATGAIFRIAGGL